MSVELRSWKKASTDGRLIDAGSARNKDAEKAALAIASSGLAMAAQLLARARPPRAQRKYCS